MTRARLLIPAVLLAVLLCPSASRAAQTVSGTVELPTFGSPAAERVLYTASADENGVFGWVIHLAHGGSFVLTGTGGATSLEDVDVYFYSGLDATVPTGTFAGTGNEAGAVPDGSVWAIVTLAAGAQGAFTFVY